MRSASTVSYGQAQRTARSPSETRFICCLNINGFNDFVLPLHFIKRSISNLKYAVYKGSTSTCTAMKCYKGAASPCQLSPPRANSYACKFSRVKRQYFFAEFPESGNRSLAQTGRRGYLHSITSNILIVLEDDYSAPPYPPPLFFPVPEDRALKMFNQLKGHMQTGPTWIFFLDSVSSIANNRRHTLPH